MLYRSPSFWYIQFILSQGIPKKLLGIPETSFIVHHAHILAKKRFWKVLSCVARNKKLKEIGVGVDRDGRGKNQQW